LQTINPLQKVVPNNIRALTSAWDGVKDGKHYWKNADRKDMRK